jgi:hypothetical protein
MKRLIGIICSLALLGAAAAQVGETLDFDVVVEPVAAIAVDTLGGRFIDDLVITYDLNSDQPLDIADAIGFHLRYIINKVDRDVELAGRVYEDPVDEGQRPSYQEETRRMQQFRSAGITVAAGALDGGSLTKVDAFDDALWLSLSAPGTCGHTALAADFSDPGDFDAYFWTDGEETVQYPGASFSPESRSRARANAGEVQAAGADGLRVDFDGEPVALVGREPGSDGMWDSLIRGAACGSQPGDGLDVTVTPQVNPDRILPEGTTDVAIVITMEEVDF